MNKQKMNQYTAFLLLLPVFACANELPPPKAEPKPVKAAESHAAPAPEVKTVSKHAAPQQMTEPIKILKPAAEHAPAPEEHAAAAEAIKPVATPPVVRYVSPQFSSAKAAAHRPVVRSQAPKRSHAAPSSTTTQSYAMTPGLVRVLPATQIPSSAVLPPAKGAQKTMLAPSSTKSNVVWGGTNDVEAVKPPEPVIPVAGRKIASPKFYTESNPELRWQYYSYP